MSIGDNIKNAASSWVDENLNESSKRALGIGTEQKKDNKKPGGSLPWPKQSLDSEEQAFWNPIDIDSKRWNKMYPYRFLVVDVTNPTNPIIKSSGEAGGLQKSNIDTKIDEVPTAYGIEYVLAQEVLNGLWEVKLPITPQQLQITDVFAINTTATARGIVEEHNGIKFKNIIIDGTTGIWPLRNTKGNKVESPTGFETIFGGTIDAIGALRSSFNQVSSALTGKHPNQMNDITPQDENFSTGYYQFLYLNQFFERYSMLKKRSENKNLRLVFDIPKQNQSFVVTPMAFTFKQSAQNPNEMRYNIQLRAWKRIKLSSTPEAAKQNESAGSLNINDIQKAINAINGTRQLIGSAVNVIRAVRSDVLKPFEILRQATLAVKELGGAIYTAADMPNQLIKDIRSSLQESANNLGSAFQRPNDHGNNSGFVASATLTKKSSDSRKSGQVVETLLQKSQLNEGLSYDQVKEGALGKEASDQLQADPLEEVFKSPEEYFDFFNAFELDGLDLTPQQEDAIQREVDSVSLLTVDDFRAYRNYMVTLAADIANNFGAGNPAYSDIYGVKPPTSRAIPMSIEENEILLSIYDALQVFDLLTSTKKYDDLKVENSLEYVGGLASETEIDFQVSSSKKPAPVPFGLTIEEIAARYLEDADRWIEIVTINNLRSPYIDEDGFFLSFLSNGDGRQFTVEDTENRLYVGQKILMSSNLIPVFSRKIINLEEISENNYLVTVDGLGDLDLLKTANNAKMQGFLPGTVNSQNQIFLPVNASPLEDDRTHNINGLTDPYLTKISKIDWLLKDDGDIALDSLGDLRLANGLTNLIQSLKLKIRTKKGSLLNHLDYGLGIQPGVSIADIEAGAVISELNRMVEGDSRFQGVDKIFIKLSGPVLLVNMQVSVVNGGGVLPISLKVPIS